MKQNFLTYCLIILLAAAVTGCGPKRGKDLSDYPDATTGDSMMYYYAQMRAHEYWKAAMKDTTLRDPEQRRLFLEGVKAGIDAIRMDSKYRAYNRGVSRGAMMAIRFLFFEDTYGISLNEDILIESLAYGLENSEKSGSEFQYQNEFYRLYDRVKDQHRERTQTQSHDNLEDAAKKLGMKEISNELYYRVVKTGSGAFAQRGDAVYTDVEYERADGSEVGIPSPERLTIGAPGMPAAMEQAYLHMNKGMSAIFATTADAIFGERSEIIGMRPDEVLIVKVTVTDIKTDVNHTYDNTDHLF